MSCTQDERVREASRRSVVHGDADVIVGPWTGEVGFELMYWIPFLTWLVEQGLGRQRIVVRVEGRRGTLVSPPDVALRRHPRSADA